MLNNASVMPSSMLDKLQIGSDIEVCAQTL